MRWTVGAGSAGAQSMGAQSTGALYDQIASDIRAAIAKGELTPGARLPPARELAAVLGVNMHTVLKAYTLLRDEGTVTLQRGRGATVCDAPSRLHQLVRSLVEEARLAGVAGHDLLTLITAAEADVVAEAQ